MPVTNLTLVALGLHLLGDYHLQWPSLAEGKLEKPSSFSLHVLIYAALFAFPALANIRALPAMAAIAVSHLIIDLIKRLIVSRTGAKHKMALYLADQGLHILAIVLVCEVLFRAALLPAFVAWDRTLIKWALLAVFITKPANITMKLVLRKYALDPQAQAEGQAGVAGAGALIGSLERALAAILLGLGQYAAIGLVFTAKSVARFDRISKDQNFAEYYLIGSLSSLLWVFAGWLLLFHVMP